MTGDDSITGAMRIQGYALLLMGSFPPSVKKKLFFKLLNEMQVKLSEEELTMMENFYAEPSLVPVPPSGFVSVQSSEPQATYVIAHGKDDKPPKYCAFCGGDATFSSLNGLKCSRCWKSPFECDCEPPPKLTMGAVRCPNCSSVSPDIHNYCWFCGKKFDRKEETASK